MKRPMPVPTMAQPPAKRPAAEAGPPSAAAAAVRPAAQAAGHDEPPSSPAFRYEHGVVQSVGGSDCAACSSTTLIGISSNCHAITTP